MQKLILQTLLLVCLLNGPVVAQNNMVVLQTDFGTKDGAVAAMKGVALTVSPALQLYDLTHEIPAYNTWEAGYRLQQTAAYWPIGTVFVSVVDPGVGTERKSVVLKTRSGHYFIGPDNGQFTLIAESLGIDSIYEIDEAVNRRRDSRNSYTFHGRDVYAYTAARLACRQILLTQVGQKQRNEVVSIAYQQASLKNNSISGNIPILDIQYGNVWTNIDTVLLNKAGIEKGEILQVIIKHKGRVVYRGQLPFVNTFGEVPEGKPLAYLNSLMQLSFAINMRSFAGKFKIQSGPEWSVEVLPKK